MSSLAKVEEVKVVADGYEKSKEPVAGVKRKFEEVDINLTTATATTWPPRQDPPITELPPLATPPPIKSEPAPIVLSAEQNRVLEMVNSSFVSIPQGIQLRLCRFIGAKTSFSLGQPVGTHFLFLPVRFTSFI
jgi:hypothetical protein